MTELHQATRWIMRVARLRAYDQHGSAAFEAALREAGLTPSPSRISRWEYGRTSASARVLRAYERGAGLPPYLLFALNDRRERAGTGVFATQPTTDPTEDVAVEDLYDALDRATSGGEVTSSDWYLLAAFVSLNSFFYLTPQHSALVARRLLEELIVSVGAGYVLRFEALHLFASIERLHVALEDALRHLVEAEPAGLIGEALSVVLRSRENPASEITRQIGRSSSAPVRDGVRWLEDILADRWIEGQSPAARRGSPESALLTAALPRWASTGIEDDVAAVLLRTALHDRSRLRRHEAATLLMVAEVAEHIGGPLLDLIEAAESEDDRVRRAQLLEYMIPTPHADRVLGLATASIREGADPELVRALWNARSHASEPIEVGPALLEALADPEHGYLVVAALAMTGSLDLLRRGDIPAQLVGTVQWWQERRPLLRV